MGQCRPGYDPELLTMTPLASYQQNRTCDCRYDVNVTPDKRKVFLHHEAEILQALQQVY